MPDPIADPRTQAESAAGQRAEMREIADATADRVDASYEVLGRVELHDAASRTQAEKFADLARELGCDESEERFGERLKRLAASASSSEKPGADA